MDSELSLIELTTGGYRQQQDQEEWAELYSEAIWLERWRNRNRAEMIAALFGEKKR